MTFGLTSTGFVLKRLVDAQAELIATWLATFGADADISASSPDGQLIGVYAEQAAAIWELLETVFAAGSPAGASGVAQDRLFLLANKRRLPARPTTIVAQLGGTPATTIPAGSLVATSGGAVQATLDADVVLDGSGNGVGNFTATSPGPLLVLAGTFTHIVNPRTGWTSVTNALDGRTGADIETDEAFDARRQQAISTVTGSAAPSMQSRVGNLAGVIETRLIRNTTDQADADGRPGHSFELVVRGGDDGAVASAIFNACAPDVATVGTQSVVVFDLAGDPQTVHFSRETDVPIYMTVELQVSRAFPSNGRAQVLAALLAYGATSARMGAPLAPFPFEQAARAVPGILSFELRFGRVPDPTTVGVFPLGPSELPVFDSTRVRFS